MVPVEIPASLHPTPGARQRIYGAGRTDVAELPAVVDAEGLVLTEWLPTAEELDRLLRGARVRLFVWTGGKPLQPVALDVAAVEAGE